MNFAKGLIRDTGSVPRSSFGNLRSGLAGATPRGAADLSTFLPPVLDQNWVGSCVCNAMPVAAAATLAASGDPLGFTPSVKAAYNVALALDRAAAYPKTPAASLPPLADVGTQLMVGAKVLASWGVVPMGPKVIVGGRLRESDCGPSDIEEPELLTLEQMSTRLVVGAFELDDFRTLKNDMQLALDHGILVAQGGWVDSRFERYTTTSAPVGHQDEADLAGGGHATLVYGYRETAVGTRWLCRNSWGTSWGQAGNFEATDDFVLGRWETFCMSVRRAS